MKVKKITPFISILTVLLFLLPGVSESQNLSGKWEGNVSLPGMELQVIINLDETDDEISGKIDIPQQQALGLNLSGFSREDDSIQFAINGIPGDPTFHGIIESENRIAGDFKQGGQTFPFSIERESEDKAEARRVSHEEFADEVRTISEEALEYWNIPGLAVALIIDGEVFLNEGFGYRNLEDQLPATPNTQFAIGSTTKAFTALGTALLADEGLIDWEEPVITYLPDFRMYDEFATTRLNTIDLLTHQSGLPRHDLVWYGSDRTRQQLYHSLAHLEPSADIRVKFQYQNLMYMTAGVLIEKLSGQSWEDFTRSRIFEPLEITNASLSVTDMEEAADYSIAYLVQDGQPEPVPFRNIDEVGPAGSINASTTEMLKWIDYLLKNNESALETVAGESTIDQLFLPRIVMGSGTGEVKKTSYGLGWMLDVYRGHHHYHHGGGIDGFIAQVGLFPEKNAGYVVLTNNMSNQAGAMIGRMFADHLFELEPINWQARFMPPAEEDEPEDTQPEDMLAEDTADTEPENRVTGTNPSFSLDKYAGTYQNKGYGNLKISYDEDELSAVYNGMNIQLNHWHFDVFKGTVDAGPGMEILIHFHMNADAQINALSVPLEPFLGPMRFDLQPDQTFFSSEYLSKFTGNYQLGPQSVRIERVGNQLRLTITNQPPYMLSPRGENQFGLENMEGYRMRFEFDDGEKAQRAIFIQPNGTFEAVRIE